jgi:hypothetical protein
MAGLFRLFGKTVRGMLIVRGVLAAFAGVVLLVLGVFKWDLRLFGLGVAAALSAVYFFWRARAWSEMLGDDAPAPADKARAKAKARPPLPRAVATRAPTPAPVVRPAVPAAPPVFVPRPPPVERKPEKEYATDDGGPRFLR